MEKKYILTDETIEHLGHTLHRIKAVRDFDCVRAGDLGGFIESEKNLDHDGDARVSGEARVSRTIRYCIDQRVWKRISCHKLFSLCGWSCPLPVRLFLRDR